MRWFIRRTCSRESVSDVLFLMRLTSFFLSPILVMCLVGRGLELVHPVVSTGLSCFTISLSQPYAQYGRGPAGRRTSWLSSSQSWHVNNIRQRALLRRRLFVTGSDCFGNSFLLDFQFLADRKYYVSMYWNVCLLKWRCWNKALFSSTFL
jgi:hypothetical protein